MKTRAGTACSGALAACVAALLFAPPVWAHDAPIGFTPADGATVTTAPAKVSVSFEEPPGAGPVSLTVTAPDGHSVATGSAVVTDGRLAAPVHLEAAGRYRVSYSIVSDDGHPVSGRFSFVYDAAGKTTPAATPVIGPSHRGERLWKSFLPLVAAAIAVGGAVALVSARRKLETATRP